MSTTETYIGMEGEKSSSRVLKPPGGGHSNIFSPAQQVKPHARPKYDQQNSSNLNFCMNTVDPNEKVAKIGGNPDSAAADVVLRDSASEVAAAAAPQSDQGDAKAAANLPTYHHHRSTALW